jgi:hypothetical protein
MAADGTAVTMAAADGMAATTHMVADGILPVEDGTAVIISPVLPIATTDMPTMAVAVIREAKE